MSDARLPGPLGFSLTPQIDFGTLARVASPFPNPIGIEDPMVEWAKRQLRRGVKQGLDLVVDAAYDAAMAEIQRVKNDVEKVLRIIAALPDDLRRRVAYEVFAAFFSHYLPKKLIRHYVYANGRKMKLTQQEMIDCNPYISLLYSKAFVALIDQANKSPGIPVPFELPVKAGALTNGTLGQFTVKTKGTLVAFGNGKWLAAGTMTFFDVWDFDPKDWTTGGRSFQGEVKTRVANALLPGTGFDIDSVETSFSQTQDDETVTWAGGTPQGEPDRIAALDVELKKPDK
jgi:hypothetical protein